METLGPDYIANEGYDFGNEIDEESTSSSLDSHGSESTLVKRKKRLKEKIKRKFQKLSLKGIVNGIWKFITTLIYQYQQYVLYNMRETMKRKFNYCLGMLSCLIVVLVMSVSFSSLNQIPIIFLRLAENAHAQFDVKMRLTTNLGATLNYTVFQENIRKGADNLEEYSFHAPRIEFPDSVVFLAKDCKYQENVLPTAYNETDWMYEGVVPGDACTNCVKTYCSYPATSPFYAYYSDKEERMGFGRQWVFEEPQEGEAIISKWLAEDINANVGDTIIVEMPNAIFLTGPYREIGYITDATKQSKISYRIYVPYKVVGINDNIYAGKADLGTDEHVFVQYSSFFKHISKFLPKKLRTERNMEIFSKINPSEYATNVFANIPNRVQKYNRNDYKDVQNTITGFASRLSYFVGYNQIAASFPLLEYLFLTRYFSMFIGLIINIIITVLTVLSVILIYSLLMINVENRTFEMGVFRMIGMKKSGIVQLVFLQSLMYAIPGVLLGLLGGQMIYTGIAILLSSLFQAHVSYILGPLPALQAIGIGLAIPIISSILPIRAALGTNLTDALDTQRSKTKAVKYNIERSEDSSISWTQISLGLAAAVFGFCIYYMFPLALLTLNLTLMLYMFFAVLLGMLLGLVMLALNVETLIEQGITFFLLFWENSAVTSIMLKNLVAHRIRNRKTTIMYSLSLGFVIFIAVSFRLQISAFSFREIQRRGSRMNLVANYQSAFKQNGLIEALENLCNGNPDVLGFAYMSYEFDYVTKFKRPELVNLGKYKYEGQRIHAVSPNFFQVARKDFIRTEDAPKSGYSLTELLYTPEGSYSMLIGASYYRNIGLSDRNTPIFLELEVPTEQFPKMDYWQVRAMALMANAPGGFFSRYPNRATNVQSNFISFPMFKELSNGTFKSLVDIPIEKMFIEMPDDDTPNVIKFKADLKRTLQGTGLSVKDVIDELAPLKIASVVMDYFFIFTTIVTMILCFFSLTSSMYTNVNYGAKEIGILRAIGATRFTITRLYVYESLILVLAASCTGIVIGFVVAYTMVLQQILFTQLPLTFVFPWQICVVVFVMTFIISFLSAFIPVIGILRRNIASLQKALLT